MKKHIGLIFKTEMVKAIQQAKKTQTRRPLPYQPPVGWDVVEPPAKALGKITHRGHPKRGRMGVFITDDIYTDLIPLRYGWVGDFLYVKETWRVNEDYKLAAQMRDQKSVFYFADEPWNVDAGWRPSMIMPRWARRYDLEITRKAVERVSAITEAGAMAEGFDSVRDFKSLWDEIYGAPRARMRYGNLDYYESFPFDGPRFKQEEFNGLPHFIYGDPLVEVTHFDLRDKPLSGWELSDLGIKF